MPTDGPAHKHGKVNVQGVVVVVYLHAFFKRWKRQASMLDAAVWMIKKEKEKEKRQTEKRGTQNRTLYIWERTDRTRFKIQMQQLDIAQGNLKVKSKLKTGGRRHFAVMLRGVVRPAR